MRLLVGLGNPGEEYARSRHNAGFVALDTVIAALELGKGKNFKGGMLWEHKIGAEKVLLFKPMQFMNTSGIALKDVAHFYSLKPDEIAVLADDVYISPGSIRVRKGGGDGGHNGWKSVLEQLKSDDFWRIKIGVGLYEQHPEKRLHQPALDEYVLQPLPLHERKMMEKAVDNMVPNLIQWLEQGRIVEETVHV